MADETQDERWQRLSRDRTQKPLPKRFYTAVTVGVDHSILLDGRAVKTPLKTKLVMPTARLAEAVADEWLMQIGVINQGTMPLTKLANMAIDRLGAERAHVVHEIVAFAGSDLVCYRAQTPAALAALHAQFWDPVLEWADTVLGVKFKAVAGVIHVPQDASALDAVAQRVTGLDDYALTGVHTITTLTGSALLALMLQAKALSAETAWAAAHVDEDFQLQQWGEDFEASARRAHRKQEFEATVRFLTLIDDSDPAI